MLKERQSMVDSLLHRAKKRKTRKYGNEIAPDTVKLISFELGGRPGPQTKTVLQVLTPTLAAARGGELNESQPL